MKSHFAQSLALVGRALLVATWGLLLAGGCSSHAPEKQADKPANAPAESAPDSATGATVPATPPEPAEVDPPAEVAQPDSPAQQPIETADVAASESAADEPEGADTAVDVADEARQLRLADRGAAAGFAGGLDKGNYKVRFIRLQYAGGDWDQDFGVGGDLNMLIEYGQRTKRKCADKTESRTIAQLAKFPLGQGPPVMYLTGQDGIWLSDEEIKTLREYLTDKHGMLFGDNGGSGQFHNQFLSMMMKVLPDVRPVVVPLDDPIHQVPYPIESVPCVAPHGGHDALGWKHDDHWVCYYHPGDIGDAWRDGHSGASPELTESCYQLGTNIISYAHAEYDKWREAQSKAR